MRAARKMGWMLALTAVVTLLGASLHSMAGTMTRATLEPLFPAPLMLGDKSAMLAAWPIFRRDDAGPQLVGHVFETVDLEPSAGYGGKPINTRQRHKSTRSERATDSAVARRSLTFRRKQSSCSTRRAS